MSLLADMLSRAKKNDQEIIVPPGLTGIVHQTSKAHKTEKKIKIVLIITLLLVVLGFGLVYIVNVYMGPTSEISNRQAATPGAVPTAVEGQRGQGAAKFEPSAVPAPVNPAAPSQPGSLHENAPPAAGGPIEKPRPENTEVKAQADLQTAPKVQPQANAPEFRVVKRAAAPDKSSSGRDETAKSEKDAALYAAKNFEENRNYNQAIAGYKKALSQDPKNYLIMNNIAGLLITTGAYAESLKYSLDSLTVSKNYTPSLVNAAIANIQLGNKTEGEMYLLKAHTLEPANKKVLLNLALSYEKRENYSEAFNTFQRLAGMKDSQGALGAARVLEKQGKYNEAGNLYREIIAADYADAESKAIAADRIRALAGR